MKDIEQPLEAFIERTSVLGAQLGCLLFQLPPNMKIDLQRLGGLLRAVPKGTRLALEVRNESWFTEETYALLRKHGQALCIAESDEFTTPFVATADFGYLRLREKTYTSVELADYVAKLRAQRWDDCFVFFKHEDGGFGAQFARELLTAAR